MSMLDRLKDREEITIWIGCVDKPIDCVIAAIKLAETLKQNPSVHFGPSPPKKNAPIDDHEEQWNNIRVEMQLQQHAPVDDIDEGEQESEQKRKKKSAPKIQKPKKLPVKRKLHLHNDKETMPSQTTFSNAPVIQTQTNTSLEKPSNLKCNSGIALHKIPRTTTDRKKIVQTNKPMVDAMVVSESEFNKAVRRLEARDAQVGRTYETGETSRAAVEDDMDEGAEVEDYIGEGAVLEDFIGEGDELDNEMNEDAQLDDDMEEEEEIGCVQDTYDPYSSNCWQRGLYADETYFSRLYRNGDFVTNLEFGNIVLKPWMIFSDKEHFMSVFRDYCIQCGFAVVVDRSSPRRFTASCLALLWLENLFKQAT
ncbi:uncharacterized protein LOC110727305 [Chenopodium quinoa]|uniref:uncharacterized protein LOC110727305 n=1 Tax=Chenopodium quinoa TaxID=63459 RepID=UPI000B780945|nr:uncharacterized protein LOC110727305 [Chenopodium quinoa]